MDPDQSIPDERIIFFHAQTPAQDKGTESAVDSEHRVLVMYLEPLVMQRPVTQLQL